MIDALCLGSVTLDLFFRDESLTQEHGRFALALGGKYVVGEFKDGMGGGGANIAIGLARAGLKSGLWSQVGKGGLSLYIEEKLTHEGVDISLLEKREGFANLSAILLSEKGERTILTHRSDSIALSFSEKEKDALKETRMLFIGNMPELTLDMRLEAMEIVSRAGGTVALNFGVKDCRKGIQALRKLFLAADIILSNRYELADILGAQGNEIHPLEVNYHKSLGLSTKTLLVITDGEFGSYAQSDGGIVHQKPVPVTRVTDTTGAGDAFTTGFLAGVSYKKTVQVCMHAGATNAASVIRHLTAQKGLLSYEELFEKV